MDDNFIMLADLIEKHIVLTKAISDYQYEIDKLHEKVDKKKWEAYGQQTQ